MHLSSHPQKRLISSWRSCGSAPWFGCKRRSPYMFTLCFKPCWQAGWHVAETGRSGAACGSFLWWFNRHLIHGTAPSSPHPPRCAAPHTRRTSGTVRLQHRLTRTTRASKTAPAGGIINPEPASLLFWFRRSFIWWVFSQFWRAITFKERHTTSLLQVHEDFITLFEKSVVTFWCLLRLEVYPHSAM